MKDLTNYYRLIGILRGSGHDEDQANHEAEQMLEAMMTPNELNMSGDKGLVVEADRNRFQNTIVKP